MCTVPAGSQSASQPNPLLKEWTTPFGVPPFAEIKPEHILPAIKQAVAEQRKEVDEIAADPAPPTFANTVEALEVTGELLARVSPVFSNLQSANTNAELQAINREVSPMLSALRDDIRLNAKLFERVTTVWKARETLGLTPVQKKPRPRPGCTAS
jgi:peptidyl-dipeptidase Dcp